MRDALFDLLGAVEGIPQFSQNCPGAIPFFLHQVQKAEFISEW